MYEKADIRISIDSIKVRLARDLFKDSYLDSNEKSQIKHSKLINEILELYKEEIGNNEIYLFFNKDSRAYILGFTDSITFCKIQSIHNPNREYEELQECTIEIYGLNQVFNVFNNNCIYDFPPIQKKLIEYIPKLYNLNNGDLYPPSIVKIDISLDSYYDYNKTLVHYNSQFNNINDQKKDKIYYLNGFGTITMIIPLDTNEKVIYDLIKSYDIKVNKTTKGNYITPVKECAGFNTVIYKSYTKCDLEEATHIKLILRDRKKYLKYKKLFEDNNIKVDYKELNDYDTDIQIKKNKRKVSIITYDKTYKDSKDKHKFLLTEDYYNRLVNYYSTNDNEYDLLLDTLNQHTRNELRFTYSVNELPIIDINKNLVNDTFRIISNDIEKQLNKLSISIFKTYSDIKEYLKENRKYTKDKKTNKPLKIGNYGKILDVRENDLEKCINQLKLCFKTVKNRSKKRVNLGFTNRKK